MTDKRIFLETELPASYQSVYSSPGAGTLLIQDSSHQHPTLIAHAATTAGTLQWGGQGSFTQPLSDGELHPTAYVHSTGEMDYTVTLTVGIVDYDPCSGPDAATFAQAQAGVFGVAWPSLTSCLSSPSWSVMADGNPSEPSTLVFLDAMTPLGSGATRALEITGLPTGVTWRRLPDSSLSLVLELTAHEDVTPGQYPLTLSTATHTTLGGVTVVSEQSQTTGTLEVLSPPPPVIDVVDDPPPAASPSSGTSVPSPEPEVVATPEVAQPPRTPLPPAPVPAEHRSGQRGTPRRRPFCSGSAVAARAPGCFSQRTHSRTSSGKRPVGNICGCGGDRRWSLRGHSTPEEPGGALPRGTLAGGARAHLGPR